MATEETCDKCGWKGNVFKVYNVWECAGCGELQKCDTSLVPLDSAGYQAKVVKETPFRSKPMINMTDDMVKVELTMSCNDWRQLKKRLNNLA